MPPGALGRMTDCLRAQLSQQPATPQPARGRQAYAESGQQRVTGISGHIFPPRYHSASLLPYGVQTFIDPPPHPADPHVQFSLALLNLGIRHGFQFTVYSSQFSIPHSASRSQALPGNGTFTQLLQCYKETEPWSIVFPGRAWEQGTFLSHTYFLKSL